MADQVNIDLLGQAYCNVLTRKTGIKHTYTIKGKDGENKMNNLVIMKNQQAVTSSLQVAEVFENNISMFWKLLMN